MRVNHPLFFLSIVFILFSNSIFSQSSIFHDAEELAKYLDQNRALHIHFQVSGKSQAKINIKLDTVTIKPIANRKFELSSYGYYKVDIKNWGENDSLKIYSADKSIVEVLGKMESVSISNTPTSWGAQIVESKGYMIENEDGSQSFISGSLANIHHEKKGEFDASKKVINILSSHSNFRKKDSKTPISFQSLQYEYSTNPFLNNLNINSPLLEPDVDRFFKQDYYNNIKFQFDSTYASNYEWDKLLYGDSILQLQKNVSIQDASTNYRNRIVTSQRVLEVENKQINDTNKKRNLLDAKTVAVGLSDFIAERAQEELNLTFFNRFKKNLNKKSELTILFPNTKKLLYQFKISDYKILLSHARESFEVDLENLGLHFPEVLELPKYREKLYNSPDVFNLALIYSIANLAYRDVPVESILISGFQKLEHRKIELGKSINLRLADTFLKPEKIKGDQSENPIINNRNELVTLKKYVKEYLEALDKNDNLILDRIEEMRPLRNGQIHNLTSYSLSDKNKMDDIWYDYTKSIQPIYKIHNRKIASEYYVNYHNKTTLNYLDKKDYFGYILSNPKTEDYNLIFKKQPKTENELLAQGLKGCNKLLTENHYENIKKSHDKIRSIIKTSREVKTISLHQEKNNQSKEYQIREFVKKTRHLNNSLLRELEFWRKATNLDDSDHYIAGLSYINWLLYRDNNIEPFFDLSQEIGQGEHIDTLIQDYYFNTLKENFSASLKAAYVKLDSIEKIFEEQVSLLKEVHGGISIDAAHYELLCKDTKYHVDSSRVEFNLRLSEDIALAQFKFKEQHLIDDLTQEIKDLKRLSNTATEQEKIDLDNKVEQLNNKRDELAEKMETEEENFIEQFEEELLKKREMQDSLIAKVRKDYQNNLVTTSQKKSLREFYTLKDNSFFQQFLTYKTTLELQDSSEFIWHNEFDKRINQQVQDIEELKDKRDQLQDHLTYLENKYCNDLVQAKQNAQNLAKGIELSTHLLFAFRDYEKTIQPLYTKDTSVISVTVNQIDSLSGFVKKIFNSDSLRVDTALIKGTEKPSVAARWISKDQFRELRENEVQWNIFLGLLYQRLRSIDDAPNFSAEGVAILATKFLDIAHEMDTHRNQLRRKKGSNNDTSFKDYYPFIRSTVDLFNTVLTTPSFGDTSTLSNKYKLQNIPRISNEALSLYENIYVKEYGNAVLNTMELLKIISARKLNGSDKDESERAINAVLTYGTFMANMINAKTSDQVKRILQAATLPPGSSRIKRETVSSFTINSYLGLGAGRDRLLNIPSNIDITKDALGASLSVPIGFTYSFVPKKWRRKSSFSLHMPLIDLGAITAYRQNPDNDNYSIDNLPDFSWNNLFSPGLFVVYNVGNSPFSIGFGGQYGPQLREIKLNTGEAVNVNSWRFPMIFVSIDVPFFNLHTGARRITID